MRPRQVRALRLAGTLALPCDMPSVIDYEEVKASFPDIFEYVSGKKGVVTVTYGGKAAVRHFTTKVFRGRKTTLGAITSTHDMLAMAEGEK